MTTDRVLTAFNESSSTSKLSLSDKLNRPLHDLRISVIDRCNFRCPYCMPEKEYSKHYTFLKENEWLTFEEIVRLTKPFVECGISKVRLTGGEPLLRPHLIQLIKDLKNIPGIDDLALTTNGSLLAKYAADLKAAGLNRLTVSLDTLDSRIFKAMSGAKGSVNQVLEGLREAQKAGFEAIKINVVVQKGVNDHAILDLVEYFKNTKYILRFIEYMDVGNCNHWESKYVVPSADIIKIIGGRYPLKQIESNYYGEVAERYQFADERSELGFISSVTNPFCRCCTRARLSTDGKIYTCLFAGEGTDLRAPLREGANDQQLFEVIRDVWQNREDRYSELRPKILPAHTASHKVEMFQIGG